MDDAFGNFRTCLSRKIRFGATVFGLTCKQVAPDIHSPYDEGSNVNTAGPQSGSFLKVLSDSNLVEATIWCESHFKVLFSPIRTLPLTSY
jgi:hypothetical protein